jgi:hypothetical protein
MQMRHREIYGIKAGKNDPWAQGFDITEKTRKNYNFIHHKLFPSRVSFNLQHTLCSCSLILKHVSFDLGQGSGINPRFSRSITIYILK